MPVAAPESPWDVSAAGGLPGAAACPVWMVISSPTLARRRQRAKMHAACVSGPRRTSYAETGTHESGHTVHAICAVIGTPPRPFCCPVSLVGGFKMRIGALRTGAQRVPPAVQTATASLAAQLRALAGGAGGGVSVLDAACGVLLAGRQPSDDDVQVCPEEVRNDWTRPRSFQLAVSGHNATWLAAISCRRRCIAITVCTDSINLTAI